MTEISFIPGEDEEQEGDDEVGDHNVDPHVKGKGGHEGKQLRALLFWLPVDHTFDNWIKGALKLNFVSWVGLYNKGPVQDTDAQSHERV